MGASRLEVARIEGHNFESRVVGEVPLEDDGVLVAWADQHSVAHEGLDGGHGRREREDNRRGNHGTGAQPKKSEMGFLRGSCNAP